MPPHDTPQSFADALGEAFDDVKPIQQSDTATELVRSQRRDSELLAKALKREAILAVDENDSNPLSATLRVAVQPDDMLSFKRPGIQEGVFKNLRLGKYPIEGRIELQRLRLEEARKTLYSELQKHHSKGVRTLVIKHGRGENSKPIPALCKSYVNQWLQEMSEVIAFHSAQKQHGSLAATYVLLKKHPDQKQINRERLYQRGR